jgi:hypothetical protein
MTAAERQRRWLATRSQRLRDAAPNHPGIVTAAELAAMLGLGEVDPKVLAAIPTMPDDELAALQAQPGGMPEPEDGQPEIGLDGEPIYPGDSGSL